MADSTSPTTDKRHDNIYNEYTKRLEELGDQATAVSKGSIYEEVAKRTGYSCSRVSHIVTGKFRKNGRAKR